MKEFILCLFLVFFSSATSQLVTSANYVGCFADNYGWRDLPVTIALHPNLIGFGRCYQEAVNSGYTYFSVQYGGECFLGNRSVFD